MRILTSYSRASEPGTKDILYSKGQPLYPEVIPHIYQYFYLDNHFNGKDVRCNKFSLLAENIRGGRNRFEVKR